MTTLSPLPHATGENTRDHSAKTGNVAFVGLGNMGRRMASRLVTAGYAVRVFDTNPEAVQALVALGATAGTTPADTAEGADFILSSLPNPAIVHNVYLGDGGLAEKAKPGAVAIDFSTIDPATVNRIANALAERSVKFLDAPVSRGVTGAENGTLAIMVGGDTAALESAAPLLENLGNTITHVGESGSGQLVKLCNNMISAITTVALGEVMVMGRSAGLDTKTMYDVLTSGSADSHMLNSYFPRTIFGESRPTGFTLDFMAKDLDLFLDTGNKTEVPMLLSGLVRQVYRIAQDQGLGSQDSCSVVEFYEKLAGVRLQF
jgi:3-hydroxyisobutyrate dehydrogenase